MKEDQAIRKGVTQAAFGFLLIHFHLNIGTVDLLPDFMGYVLLLLAIHNLKEENRDFALLMPLGTLLTGWNLADWLLNMFGIPMTGKLPVPEAMMTAVNLYFWFQFCTDLAQLARKIQPEEGSLNRSICRCRNILTVTMTVMALPLEMVFPEDRLIWILSPVLVIGLAAVLGLTVKLFALRKAVSNLYPG